MANLPCMCPAPTLGALPDEQCRDVAGGNLAEVLSWLSRGGDVNAANRWGNTLLSLASANGHTHVVAALMKRPSLHLNVKNNEKETALAIAASEGHWDIVDMLLRKPIRCRLSIQTPKEMQKTPVMYAAEANEWALVRSFFELDYKLREDEAAFVIRAAGKAKAWQAILHILKKDYHFRPDRFLPVLEAAYEGDAWEVIFAFLRQGFSDKSDEVNFWLSKAILAQKWPGVQSLLLLLKQSIKLNTKLVEAAISGHMETVKEILEEISHDRDALDGAVLVVAAAGCSEPVAKFLLENYSQEDDQSAVLPNCLFLATMNNHLEMLPTLLRDHSKCFSYTHLSKAQEVAKRNDFSNVDRLLLTALEMKAKEVLHTEEEKKT